MWALTWAVGKRTASYFAVALVASVESLVAIGVVVAPIPFAVSVFLLARTIYLVESV